MPRSSLSFFFFFNDTATTEIYTLSLHDALPIYRSRRPRHDGRGVAGDQGGRLTGGARPGAPERCRAGRARSEEHTSELQSHLNLVCRLLLEKKKKITSSTIFMYDDACYHLLLVL